MAKSPRNYSIFSTDASNLMYALGNAVKDGNQSVILEAAVKFGEYYNVTQAESKGRANKPTETEAAKLLADAANAMGFNHDAFFEALRFEHRTIQQSVLRVMIEYVKRLSLIKDNETDGRNAASVRLARAIVEADRNGIVNLALPLV